MTPPKKPEWFELRDNDNNAPRPEGKRFKRGVLLAVPFLIVGIGAVAAQIGEDSPAEAENVVATASVTPEEAVITPSAPSTPDAPSIATLPTKPRGGDDDDDHEGFKPRRPHHGEERHDFDDDDEFEGDDD